MIPATFEAAARAKARLMETLEGHPDVASIGIAIVDGGFGVKVNLLRPTEPPIPEEFEGAPVIVDTTGGVSAL